MFITQHIRFPLFSVLSYDSYHGQPHLYAFLSHSKQTLLCNKYNVSLRHPFPSPSTSFQYSTLKRRRMLAVGLPNISIVGAHCES